MPSLYLPTFRRGTPEQGRAVWADLRVALMSVEAYGLDYLDEVIVAWDGPWEPDGVPTHPKFRYIERPPGMNQPVASNFAIEHARTDELIQMADDVVLHPETLPFLFQDIAMIRQAAPDVKIGAVGTRSNFVCGQQNIRQPNNSQLDPWGIYYQSEGQILQVDRIFPVLMWFPRDVWSSMGGLEADIVGMGDMLFSYDVEQLGYSMFVSRAYVHHVGMLGTKSAGDDPQRLYEDGVRWLERHRPGFLPTWIARGYIKADEVERVLGHPVAMQSA